MRYNERVRIDGARRHDDALIAAFNAVEDARADVPLTYFEYGTLAALWLFARAELDVAVLEVGLGGRLDAVNVVDADVAVVTSVDLDHMDYLGPTREDIGREKAGIFRAGTTGRVRRSGSAAVARRARARARRAARADRPRLRLRRAGPAMALLGARRPAPRPAVPALRGAYQLANAATALAALDLLRDRLQVSAGAVRDGLVAVEPQRALPGAAGTADDRARRRAQSACGARAGGSARVDGRFPQTIAVFGMLADKDIDGVIAAMRARVDRWHVAPLPGPRGASAAASLRGARERRRGGERDTHRSTTSDRRSPRRGTQRVKLIELSFSDRS